MIVLQWRLRTRPHARAVVVMQSQPRLSTVHVHLHQSGIACHHTATSPSDVQVWDVRKFKTPVAAKQDLPALFATTQCAFSPNEKLVLTGMLRSPSP